MSCIYPCITAVSPIHHPFMSLCYQHCRQQLLCSCTPLHLHWSCSADLCGVGRLNIQSQSTDNRVGQSARCVNPRIIGSGMWIWRLYFLSITFKKVCCGSKICVADNFNHNKNITFKFAAAAATLVTDQVVLVLQCSGLTTEAWQA